MVQVGLLGGAFAWMQTTLAATARIDELLAIEPSVKDGPDTLAEFRDRIVLRDVAFDYGGERVLAGVSFEILNGEGVTLGAPRRAGKAPPARPPLPPSHP